MFDNKINEDANSTVRRINSILRKNRRILAKLNPDGKKTVDGITLAEEGFNFHYFTNIYRTQKGSKYFFCYDFGYIKLENDQAFRSFGLKSGWATTNTHNTQHKIHL